MSGIVTSSGWTAGSKIKLILPRPYFSGHMIPAEEAKQAGLYPKKPYKSPFDNQVK